MGLPTLPGSTRRGYINISTSIHAMPEVWAMPPRAFVAWVYGLCWASQMRRETNWTIPHDVARTFTTKKDREALLAAEFWIDRGLHYELPRKNVRGVDLWRPGASGLRRASIPERVRRRVYERDGHACAACGATQNLSLDHIVHWSKGGSDSEHNLRTLCLPCNSSRRDRTDEEWRGIA